MKLGEFDDFDEIAEMIKNDGSNTEEEQQQKIADAQEQFDEIHAKKKTGLIGIFLTLFFCLAGLILLLYAGLILWDKLETAKAERVNFEAQQAVPVVATKTTYTEEEMQEKISAAKKNSEKLGEDRVLLELMDSLSEGKTVVETLRALYPDYLVVVSGGKYCFEPINNSLAKNTMKQENLVVLETGEYQYKVGNLVTSHKGIDVSSHQGDINWEKVAQDGVEFAFIRAVYRGYESGKLVVDEKFHQNIQGAQAAGIKVGVYVFSQAISLEEVAEEANTVIAELEPYTLDCPLVFDVEMISGNGRMNDISEEERTRITAEFCKLVERAGYKSMIYHNTEMAAVKINLADLERYDKWYASYNQTIFYPYAYKVWQYTDKGKVSGIKGNVDMNIALEPIWN